MQKEKLIKVFSAMIFSCCLFFNPNVFALAPHSIHTYPERYPSLDSWTIQSVIEAQRKVAEAREWQIEEKNNAELNRQRKQFDATILGAVISVVALGFIFFCAHLLTQIKQRLSKIERKPKRTAKLKEYVKKNLVREPVGA